MNDLVSVIVPTYNRAHCLSRAVDGALTQTHANVDVIVVDDGSTDNTAQLLAERYASEPRVRYHRQANGGAAAARNTGLTLCRGDFVALLDSDDVWQPWKLELQLACMKQHPEVGMTWTDMEAVDDKGELKNPRFLRTMYHAWRHFQPGEIFEKTRSLAEVANAAGGTLTEQLNAGRIPREAKFHAGNVFSAMIMGSLVHTSTVVLRRQRAEKVKCFNIAYTPLGEDYDFHLRTCHEGPVGFIDLPTIQYETGGADRLTRRENRLSSALNCLRTIEPFLGSPEVALPPRMIARRLGEVHQWIAEEMLAREELSGCRSHALQSLGYMPLNKRNWMLLLISLLPRSVVKARHERRERQQQAA